MLRPNTATMASSSGLHAPTPSSASTASRARAAGWLRMGDIPFPQLDRFLLVHDPTRLLEAVAGSFDVDAVAPRRELRIVYGCRLEARNSAEHEESDDGRESPEQHGHLEGNDDIRRNRHDRR